MHNYDSSQCFYCTISTDTQEMDTGTFYGRKEHDRAVRVIPSDSEDSQLESDIEHHFQNGGTRTPGGTWRNSRGSLDFFKNYLKNGIHARFLKNNYLR